MRTIETTATVNEDGELVVPGPTGLVPGRHRVVIVVEGHTKGRTRPPLRLPLHDVGPWPEGLSLRREDMYGDDGR